MASLSSKRRRLPSRFSIIVVQIVVALSLVVVLTFQAFETIRSHNALTEKLLEDYATLAAKEFVKRGTPVISFYGVTYALNRLDQTQWPEIPEVPTPRGKRLRPHELLAPRYFRFDLQADLFFAAPDSAISKDALKAELVDEAPTEAAYQVRFLESDVLVFRFIDEQRLEGFLSGKTHFVDLLKLNLSYGSLLPFTADERQVSNEDLSVMVVAPTGKMLFQNQPAHGATTSEAYFDNEFAGLLVRVTLKPETAPLLIIGESPTSRLPLLAALTLVTIALLIITLRQLKRENDLSSKQADSIAAISHELRTPLAQILMFTETLLLERVRGPEERKRSLEIIGSETKRLAELVENVVLFAEVLHRGGSGKCLELDASRLVMEVVERYQPLVSGSGTQIIMTGLDEAWVKADGRFLRRMLVNLLDNAVKYGPKGQTVEVSLEDGGKELLISVSDQGEGIPEKDRKRVWRRFERLPKHRNTAVAGTGIGLWLVHELALAQNLRVWIESASPMGAKLVIALPKMEMKGADQV